MNTSKITFSLVALVSWSLCGAVRGDQPFRRGDANQDEQVDLSDAQALLSFLFVGKADVVLDCQDSADANDDGVIDITDSVRILEFLFLGTAAFPAPGPWGCGADETKDDLGCASYGACMVALAAPVEESEAAPSEEPEEIELIVTVHVDRIEAKEVVVTFSNASGRTVNMSRIDPRGEAHHVRAVAALERFEHPTFAGTEFRFEVGSDVETYTATEEEPQYYVIRMGLEPYRIEVTIEEQPAEPVVDVPWCENRPRLCEIVANGEDINSDGYLTLYDVLPNADANGDEFVSGMELREFASLLLEHGTISVEAEAQNTGPILTLFNHAELKGSFQSLTISASAPGTCTTTVATNGGAVTIPVSCD